MRTKLKFRPVFIIFIGLIAASCEENTVITPKPEIIDPATTFLLVVKSDSLSQYYIAADFNGNIFAAPGLRIIVFLTTSFSIMHIIKTVPGSTK